MAKKKRYRKPLIKKLQEDMGLIVSEIMMMKNHIRDALQPQMQSFMSLFEKYLEYKNETEEFLQFMEKEATNAEIKVSHSSFVGKSDKILHGGG